jgi:hypothetical protein
MRKSSLIICTLVLTVLFLASNASATSFGAYLEFGSGSGEAEYDDDFSEEFDIDTGFFGIGFQFETSPVSEKKLFSYRFQAGFESREIEDDYDVTFELGGLIINNTFAFGGNPSEKIRLWGGPQILVGFYGGETDKKVDGDEISFAGAGFGLGAAGGANFALGNGRPILTTTIGLRSFSFAGRAERQDEDEALSGNAGEFFLSFGILF